MPIIERQMKNAMAIPLDLFGASTPLLRVAFDAASQPMNRVPWEP
jgi:hypothetical protein